MTVQAVMKELESMGNENTKRILMRHGAREPFFGVKIGDLKKLVKKIKKDHHLAIQLFETGNSDAMYLAGLIEDVDKVTEKQLDNWLDEAYWYMISEYIVAGLAAESPFARNKALEWMTSADELKCSAGWAVYSGMVSLLPDEELNLVEISFLMKRITETIKGCPERVKYNMNNFIISMGIYIEPLRQEALDRARQIGKVTVNLGDTSCKVPLAEDYINKTVEKGRAGKKRKRVIC